MPHLLIFGLGYSGLAVARAAVKAGWQVTATSRTPERMPPVPGITMLAFDAVRLDRVTHVLATAAPGDAGDPVLARYAGALATSRDLRWAGYMSTTSVYGDRAGGWVDEATPVAPTGPRGTRRVAAERAWAGLGDRIAVDLFRLAGIYGPGRSAFDDLRAGTARRIGRPGHAFGRIHRDDIAGAVLAAMGQSLRAGVRALNLNDDLPAEPADVVAEAARLLGVPAPVVVAYASVTLSAMAASFWAENRKVASARTQEVLGYRWRFPSYREGLRDILAAEGSDRGGEQGEVLRA